MIDIINSELLKLFIELCLFYSYVYILHYFFIYIIFMNKREINNLTLLGNTNFDNKNISVEIITKVKKISFTK